ncbi:MAG: rod shape-determining protein MreD [Tannerella sp.]|jgi:rod shape-determining protein MreD|nr:rod shape-determining protein MreD [Tannerella sp.]
MIKQTIHIGLRLVCFVLLQVWVLNSIHLFRVAELFLYIDVILKFPTQMSRSQMVVTSFLLGYAIDVFSNTPGMHAAACALIGFLRTPLVHVYVDREMTESVIPSFRAFGTGAFIRYGITLILIHHAALFLIESVSFFDPLFVLFRIFASAVFTALSVFVVETFNVSRKSGH